MTTLQEHDRHDVVLLPFYCPFDPAINPNAAAIERSCIEWIDRFELYGSDAQRSQLISNKAAEIYARALPDAPAERVADVAKWLYWGFATDDLLFDNGPTSVRTGDFLAIGAQFVRICEEPRARFTREPPYTEALRDLVLAVRTHSSPRQMIDWAYTARAWFFGMAWDVGNAERGAPPSINDYLMMRMHTGGLLNWVTTLNIANGLELAPSQESSSTVRALTEAWATLTLFLNDLMSFAKERKNKDNSSNLLPVIAHERGCAVGEAVPEAYDLCNRLAILFLGLRAQLLRSGDPTMQRYLESLEHTWRGILDWGFSIPRYMGGGDPGTAPLQIFPGWVTEPPDVSTEPLPYPSISWWWDEFRSGND